MGSVEIGPQEIYDAVRDLGTRLAVLAERVEAVVKTQADHEQRLRGQEERRWPIGALSLLVAVLAIVAGLVGAVIQR